MYSFGPSIKIPSTVIVPSKPTQSTPYMPNYGTDIYLSDIVTGGFSRQQTNVYSEIPINFKPFDRISVENQIRAEV